MPFLGYFSETVTGSLLNEYGIPLWNQTEVRNWQIISRIMNRCSDISILPFLHKLNNSEVLNAPDIFEKRFYSLWISAVIHSKPILSEFSGESHKNLISKYKVLDEKVRRLTVANYELLFGSNCPISIWLSP